MTTADFNLACTDLQFFTINHNGNTLYLDCPGGAYCSDCVFGSMSTTSDCYIQNRDRLTPYQFATLQTDYPEMFV